MLFKGAGFLFLHSLFPLVNSSLLFLPTAKVARESNTRILHKNCEECDTRKFNTPENPAHPPIQGLIKSLRIPEKIVKRQVHLANVEEVAIRVRVQSLKGGRYLGTSLDVPGLVAEGRSLSETIEIAQSLARKIVESCREH